MKYKIIFFFLKIWNFYVYLSLKYFIKKNKKNLSRNVKNIPKLRILFVKPYSYLDIYSLSFKSPVKTFYSSIFRFGPVGLLTNNHTDFRIIDSYDGKKINYNKVKKNNSRLNFLKIQKKQSIDVNSINFNHYDLVISFENTLSEKLTGFYPKILWAKFYDDHKSSNYKKSIFKKPVGFDLIFNQTLGFTPYSFFRKSHWIDFSYTFGNSNFLNYFNFKKVKEIDFVVEVHQKEYIKILANKINYLNSHCLDETLSQKNYLKVLAKSKFFLAVDCKLPRWGNSLIEAALCQNLLIGNRDHFWNSQLIIEELHCTNFDQAIKIIKTLKKNKKKYMSLLNKQNSRLNYFNYIRPIEQIFNYANYSKRKLNILGNL